MRRASPQERLQERIGLRNSSTGVFVTKKVAAASRIIALLIAQPTSIEKIVSAYS